MRNKCVQSIFIGDKTNYFIRPRIKTKLPELYYQPLKDLEEGRLPKDTFIKSKNTKLTEGSRQNNGK